VNKPKRLFRKRHIPDHGKLFLRAMADDEAERHAARAAMDRAIGPIPPGVDRLRREVDTIDPTAVYCVEIAGQVVTSTGLELIATACSAIALADAHEAGDEAALRRAARALLQ
jgi:hypothetical protein